MKKVIFTCLSIIAFCIDLEAQPRKFPTQQKNALKKNPHELVEGKQMKLKEKGKHAKRNQNRKSVTSTNSQVPQAKIVTK